MRHPTLVAAATLIVVVFAVPAVPAQSECEKKLAEVDAALSEGEELGENRRQMIAGMRDMAARHCKQGQQAIASQMLDGILEQLGRGDEPETKPKGISKEQLTAEYLEGWWCVRTKRYERKTPVLFEPGGAHLIGQPAGDKYGMFPSGDELKDFYRGFDRLVSKKPKRFVVHDRHGHELVYERGRCPGIETAR